MTTSQAKKSKKWVFLGRLTLPNPMSRIGFPRAGREIFKEWLKKNECFDSLTHGSVVRTRDQTVGQKSSALIDVNEWVPGFGGYSKGDRLHEIHS